MDLSRALKAVRPVLAGLAAAGLAAGLAARFAGLGGWPDVIWAAATLPMLLALRAAIVTVGDSINDAPSVAAGGHPQRARWAAGRLPPLPDSH